MAAYVLVHGSFQGGWIWKPLAGKLRAAGHAVYHPSLDGCAERSHALRPEITLDTQGAEVSGFLFYEDLTDVVLVGTSSGGMVVARAAEIVPERIRRLVFIDALVPITGETVSTVNNRPPYDPKELTYGLQPEEVKERAFPDLEPTLREWAVARYTRHPRGSHRGARRPALVLVAEVAGGRAAVHPRRRPTRGAPAAHRGASGRQLRRDRRRALPDALPHGRAGELPTGKGLNHPG